MSNKSKENGNFTHKTRFFCVDVNKYFVHRKTYITFFPFLIKRVTTLELKAFHMTILRFSLEEFVGKSVCYNLD